MIVGRIKNKIVRIVYVNENLDSFNVHLFFTMNGLQTEEFRIN